jgi:polyisoprenoid-binding protein YceI
LKKRSRWRWILGAAILLVVVFVGGPFVYIHFIEGPAPKPLSLPTTTTPKGSGASAVAFPVGIWSITSSSVVGYRVNEVLFGQNNVAVGRTHDITGSITLVGTDVTKAGFSVEMSTVHSDESQRDNQFDGRIMDVSEFPTAKFTLTSPIHLGSATGLHAGDHISATATGDLTLRGQTHHVTFTVTASYTSTAIDINGSIPITFAAWDIPNPGFGSAITTDNHGILEFLLVLKASGAGSAASS